MKIKEKHLILPLWVMAAITGISAAYLGEYAINPKHDLATCEQYQEYTNWLNLIAITPFFVGFVILGRFLEARRENKEKSDT